jgi:tripartite ATP-independent transporter DctM subunit
MPDIVIGIIGIALLFTLVLFKTYLGVALIVSSLVGLILLRGFDTATSLLSSVSFTGTAVFAFTILPMFFLMGEVALRSRMTTDLFSGFNAWLGGIRGGLALGVLGTSAAFATISGSSVAVTQMMSKVSIPEMRKVGYADRFSGSVLAATGGLAVLIPPSAMLVIYALLTEESVGQALIAGLIPGLVTVVLYFAVVLIWAKVRPKEAPRRVETVSWGDKWRAIPQTLPILLIGAAIIGGIYSGFVTPTESAAVGALAVIALALVRRRLSLGGVWDAAKAAVGANAQIFLILIGALLFAKFIAVSGVGRALAAFVSSLDVPAVVILLVIVLVYLVLGTFLEGISVLVITIPLFAPIIDYLGFDLIWFGVIVVKLIEISLLTPPLGLNVLIVASSVKGMRLGPIWARVWIFIALDLLLIAVLTMFPEIVTFLPAQMAF